MLNLGEKIVLLKINVYVKISNNLIFLTEKDQIKISVYFYVHLIML